MHAFTFESLENRATVFDRASQALKNDTTGIPISALVITSALSSEIQILNLILDFHCRIAPKRLQR